MTGGEGLDRCDLRGLLLGLADEENELLALGLLQHVDPLSERLVCLSPCAEPMRVQIVHFGALRLDPSGEELEEVAGQTGAL